MNEIIRNPFDQGGYSLAELTAAINVLPNVYTRLGQMGLFRPEYVSQRSIIVQMVKGLLNVLPTVPLGGPATVANPEQQSMRSFILPWIPHDDAIFPADIQGKPGRDGYYSVETLDAIMLRKLTRMRQKHAITREFMEVNALRGIVRDGNGVTLYNYFTEFGLTQISVDFLLGTAGTIVQGKARSVLGQMEDELQGETMTVAHALVSPEFFDKLISHAKVEEAYKFYAASEGNPLREDLRRRFPFAGILFEEYRGTVTLANGTVERLIPAGEGVVFPVGTIDTFVTYFGPMNTVEGANQPGEEIFARQLGRRDDSAVDLKTESSPLPINKRPRLVVRLFSSN